MTTALVEFLEPLYLPDVSPAPVDRSAVLLPVEHRRPPKPWWFEDQREGWCRWCGEPIQAGQRRWPGRSYWHLECLHEYRLLFDWSFVRRVILDRDRGLCRSCGLAVGRRYEVDHIRALFSWPGRRLIDLTQQTFLDWYAPWLPANLQLLCQDCHKAKSALERGTP